MKNACLFYRVFQVLKILRIKSCSKIWLPVLLFLVVWHQFLHQEILFFTTFQSLIQNYLKKNFVTNFPFLMDSPKPRSPQCPKSAMHDESFLLMLPCLVALVVNAVQQLLCSLTWIMIFQKAWLLFSRRPSALPTHPVIENSGKLVCQ